MRPYRSGPGMDLSDPRQFEYAYRQHAGRVRNAAQRILSDASAADDVAQEVFIRLWQRPHLFDPTRGSLAALLSVMARSRALDPLRAGGAGRRARGRRDGAPGGAPERRAEVKAIDPASVEGPSAALERRAQNAELRGAMLRLPP